MKNKILKILSIIILLSIIMQYIIFIQIPTISYAIEVENVINTTLGDIIFKTDCNEKLKAGDIIPIEIYITGNDIVSFMTYFKYDTEVFEEININTNVETPTGWGIMEGSDTEFGKELFIYADLNKYACSNSKIATLYLEVKKDANAVDIDFSYVNITNIAGEDNMDEEYNLPSIKLNLGEGSIIIYEVNYDLNTVDEIEAIEKGIKQEGIDYQITNIIPEREGYIFRNWNTSADGTGISYEPGEIYNIDQELTLYAQWEGKLYLSSSVYKIGYNDIMNYEDEDKYISRVQSETILQDFINNINTNGVVKVLKQDGTELQENEFVGTGMKLEVTKDNQIIELQIAVMGDFNEDGKVTVTDLSTINQALLDVIELEDEYKLAGDFDENDRITVTDLSEFNKILLESY